MKSLIITNDYITTKILSPRTLIAEVSGKIFGGGTGRCVGWIDAGTANTVTIEDFAEVPQSLKDFGWTNTRLFSAWNTQRFLATDQAKLYDDNGDVVLLGYALSKLQNLSTIRLSSLGIGGPERLTAKVLKTCSIEERPQEVMAGNFLACCWLPLWHRRCYRLMSPKLQD